MQRGLSLSKLREVRLSRRATTLSLVVALHVAVMLLALRPSSVPPSSTAGSTPIFVQLLPDTQAATQRTRTTARNPNDRRAPATASRPKPPVEAVTQPPAPSIWSQVILLDKATFAAADIARIPARNTASEDNEASGAAGESAEVVGTGPNGEKLYAAEWYRNPTPAELAYYVPAGAPRVGWGLIACRTVENYRVEDCQEIGQSPPGSGFARAVREAAWQFRVRPPRVGGRPMIGAWVRIRIDYTEEGAKS